MKKAVFGLAKNEEQANRIIDRLQDQGFDVESISFLVYDREEKLTRVNEAGVLEPILRERGSSKTRSKSTIAMEKHTKAPEGAATGATAGGIIGGSLGLLAGLGAIAIPGLGPFIAAGPILTTLGGSGVGGGIGLLVGALIGLGIPEFEAKKYENHLKAGKILLCVEPLDWNGIEKAKDLMKKEGAEDVSTVAEKTKAY